MSYEEGFWFIVGLFIGYIGMDILITIWRSKQ